MAKRHPEIKTENSITHGHRARMRQRVLDHGATSLADYELLEMLLFSVIPRRDTKPLAKNLIEHFGSLIGVFQAPTEALAEHGLNKRSLALLNIPSLAAKSLRTEETRQAPCLNEWTVLKRYLLSFLKDKPEPQTYILYLDSRNYLLRSETLPDNRIIPDDHRAIAVRTLELHATALIIIYHCITHSPTTLSQKARALKKALQPLSVEVHDAIVVGHGWSSSLKQGGLLP